jgi:hypothetical protein
MGGVMVQGTAKIIRNGALFLTVQKLLYRKFKVYESTAALRRAKRRLSK